MATNNSDVLTCAARGKEYVAQTSRSFEPGSEASPNRAYLSPVLAGGLTEARFASENNPPVFMCVVTGPWMPVFGDSLSIGRLKENLKNLQTTTQIKAQPQG